MNTDTLVLACLHCGSKNRFPLSRIDESPQCAKCHMPLPVENLSRPVIVTDATFDREVLGSPLPTMVDCWAPWCGPCKAIGPIIDSLAVKYRAKVKIAKLNLDENPMVGSRYSISSVPTVMLVKNGQVIDKIIGALPKDQMERAIERIL